MTQGLPSIAVTVVSFVSMTCWSNMDRLAAPQTLPSVSWGT